jgi:hypothetical protein
VRDEEQNSNGSENKADPKESLSSVDLLGGCPRHCHLIRQSREMRREHIARNWISRKAITPVTPPATRFVNDSGSVGGENPEPVRARGLPDTTLT